MISPFVFLLVMVSGQAVPAAPTGSPEAARLLGKAMAAGNTGANFTAKIEKEAKAKGPVKIQEAFTLWADKDNGKKLDPVSSYRLNKMFEPTQKDVTQAKETQKKMEAGEINPIRMKSLGYAGKKVYKSKTQILFESATDKETYTTQAKGFTEFVEAKAK